MKSYLRIDDFPHGAREMFQKQKPDYRGLVGSMLDVLEEEGTEYILGASPLLLDEKVDIPFLNNKIKTGWVVMHGFDHGWRFKGKWVDMKDNWKYGGEFRAKTKKKLRKQYNNSDRILRQIKRYDPKHFIAPFNAVNQPIIDVLIEKGVVHLHGCDKEYDELEQCKLEFGKLKVVLSLWQKTYCDCKKVIENFQENDSQITLHWIYDSEHAGWLDDYRELCKLVNRRNA